MSSSQLPTHLIGERYKLLKHIGSGGTSDVYHAIHTLTNQQVAIKIIPVKRVGGSKIVARFLREAKFMQTLQHHGVVKIIDAWIENKREQTCYLVMELLYGGSLREAWQKKNCTRTQSLSYILELLQPLKLAHEKGVIHRDLKPENIFLHQEGSNHTQVKILDFGLSRSALSPNITYTGQFVGTPWYTSPEQAFSPKECGPATDVWAVGILLYESLGNRVPFHGESVPMICMSIKQDPHVPLYQLNQEIPLHLSQVIDDCLVKDPSKRIPNAQILEERLQGPMREFLQLKIAQELSYGENLEVNSLFSYQSTAYTDELELTSNDTLYKTQNVSYDPFEEGFDSDAITESLNELLDSVDGSTENEIDAHIHKAKPSSRTQNLSEDKKSAPIKIMDEDQEEKDLENLDEGDYDSFDESGYENTDKRDRSLYLDQDTENILQSDLIQYVSSQQEESVSWNKSNTEVCATSTETTDSIALDESTEATENDELSQSEHDTTEANELQHLLDATPQTIPLDSMQLHEYMQKEHERTIKQNMALTPIEELSTPQVSIFPQTVELTSDLIQQHINQFENHHHESNTEMNIVNKTSMGGFESIPKFEILEDDLILHTLDTHPVHQFSKNRPRQLSIDEPLNLSKSSIQISHSTTKPLANKSIEMLSTAKIDTHPRVEQVTDFNHYEFPVSKQNTQIDYQVPNHYLPAEKKFDHFLFMMSVCILIVAFGFAIWSLL